MAKQKASKQKKMNVRVDFTPMVDMMMLLITFFMLCTSLSKPQTMELTMPSNDKNIQQQDQTDRKSTRLNSSHQIISYAVFCLKKKTPRLPTHSTLTAQTRHRKTSTSALI